MAKKILTRNLNSLSEAEYFSKIRSALRKAFQYWKPGVEALKLASRPYQGTSKLAKTQYQCAKCNDWFLKKDVAIDHIIPCGSLKNYEDIVPFIERLTTENVSDFQILCKPCHQVKTNLEKKS